MPIGSKLSASIEASCLHPTVSTVLLTFIDQFFALSQLDQINLESGILLAFGFVFKVIQT